MAEIVENKGSRKKRKKNLTRVDLTPMVDLGFLLITFFMLTTYFNEPTTMEIIMPDTGDTDQPNELKAYTALTILLNEKNEVFYYQGLKQTAEVKQTSFKSNGGLRDVIIAHKKYVNDYKQDHVGENGVESDDEASILIKPNKNSNYDNLVNSLDEMEINQISTYVLVDITEQEQNLIAQAKN